MLESFWDPNNWPVFPSKEEFRIYGDDNAQTWGVVDQEDYQFLIQWRWSWTTPKKGHRKNEKRYLRRVEEIQIDPRNFSAGGKWENPETGREVRHRKPRIQKTLRMHTIIMVRTGILPPSPDFELVDHIDGNEDNYRRKNLRWANYSLNSFNKFGKHALEYES